MAEKDISEINIIYKIKEENNIRIFGSEFVKNNKNICKMIIDNKEYEIIEKYNIKNNNNKLKIILKGIDNVTNMSDMFFGCSLLSSLPDISKWNTNNVTDMSYMFYGCLSLSSLPDISKWNTNNVINMSCMSLPEISKWNINNDIRMENILNECPNLLIPKIIKIKFNL